MNMSKKLYLNMLGFGLVILGSTLSAKFSHDQLGSFDFLPEGLVKEACKKGGPGREQYDAPCSYLQNMFSAMESIALLHSVPEEVRVKQRHNEASSVLELMGKNLRRKMSALLTPAIMRIVELEREPELQKNYQEGDLQKLRENALSMAHAFHDNLWNIRGQFLREVEKEASRLKKDDAFKGKSNILKRDGQILGANERYEPIYRAAEGLYRHWRGSFIDNYNIPHGKAEVLRLVRRNAAGKEVWGELGKSGYGFYCDENRCFRSSVLSPEPRFPLYQELMKMAQEKNTF